MPDAAFRKWMMIDFCEMLCRHAFVYSNTRHKKMDWPSAVDNRAPCSRQICEDRIALPFVSFIAS